MNAAVIRFYEELNDFLPPPKRKVPFTVVFNDNPAIKQILESEGVPHTEVDLILVNGNPVNFGEKINDGDHVSVYPVFESVDISPLSLLHPKPLREPCFVLDVHLGKLARYLRMMGFDCLYSNHYTDDELVIISLHEKRAILTRDKRLLMRKEVVRGYWLRNQGIVGQVKEVIRRFDLGNLIHSFSRCPLCNGILQQVDENKAHSAFPDHQFYPGTVFNQCPQCDHFYWKGSHCSRFEMSIRRIATSEQGSFL
jgi:uncharacterized protein